MTRHAITVLGHDRPGIIAETTGRLADLGLNLEDSTMTLLRGHFAMMLICEGTRRRPRSGPRSRRWPPTARSRSPCARCRSSRRTAAGSPWVLTVHGGDRPGIVSSVVGEVAAVGGNITDLTTRLAGELYVLVAEIDLPAGVDVDALEAPSTRGRGARRRRDAAPGRGRRPVTPDPTVLAWTEAELGVDGRVLDVVRAPARCSRPSGSSVDPTADDVVQLAADLVATMRVSPGCVGLAAPQVGVGAKVFCVDVSEHPKTREHHGTFVLCNAEVVEASRNEKAREGCMSVPDLTGDVKRATRVVVRGQLPGSGAR